MDRHITLRLSPWTVAALALATGGVLLWNAINARLDADIFFQEQDPITQTPADFGIDYEELWLETSDGVRLHAWLVPGDHGAGIVMSPGYTDSMSVILKYVPFLHEAGYTLLLYDPRGQGESGGELYAFGAFQASDIAAGIGALRARGIDSVALFGHSNGASASLRAAAQHPFPETFAVVADSPFANLKLASQSPKYRDPGLALLFPLYAGVAELRLGFDLFQRTNVLRVIDSVSHALIMHSRDDTSVTVENSELLFARAAEPKALWLVSGAAHVQLYDAYPDEYAERVLDFLKRHRPQR